MADPSYNYSYTPTVDHREANLYREEYYSSTDTKIYMDNDEQTEIGFIQYEIQEQLKPVYGYNSRTFDDVVIGNRIVTGTFTVPIKNKAKQNWDVETYNRNELSYDAGSGISQYNLNEEQNLYNTEWFGSTARNIDRHNNSNIDTQTLIKLIALGYDVTTNSSTQQYIKALKQFQNNHPDLSATGVLNNLTKQKLDEEFQMLSATSVVLNGAIGYDDFYMTRGGTTLSGNGLILQPIPTVDGLVYYVMDSQGNKYYVRGSMINV